MARFHGHYATIKPCVAGAFVTNHSKYMMSRHDITKKLQQPEPSTVLLEAILYTAQVDEFSEKKLGTEAFNRVIVNLI